MMLTPQQGRVLGALVEKERSTPQGYPLTDAALLAACNQTTSREPIVSFTLEDLRPAVRDLRAAGLLRTVHRSGERSDKHRHELAAGLDLSTEQVAVLAVLLLRGPQTAAEVRARSERLVTFPAVEQVERILHELAERTEPLAELLARQPGRKEPRWVQLLAEPVGGSPEPPPEAGEDAGDDDGRAEVAELSTRVRELTAQVHELSARVDELTSPAGEAPDAYSNVSASTSTEPVSSAESSSSPGSAPAGSSGP